MAPGTGEDEQYDEFGNFIGQFSDSDRSVESSSATESEFSEIEPSANADTDSTPFIDENIDLVTDGKTDQVVQYEDRKLYPAPHEIYGNDVEVKFEEEDIMALEEPLVAKAKPKEYSLKQSSKIPKTTYDLEYMAEIMDIPSLIRNVSIVGNLHSGKTSFVDCLVRETHPEIENSYLKNKVKNLRFTDQQISELERGISLKCSPVTLLLPNSNDKSYLANIIDTPGHINFSDEVSHSMAISDGVVIVLDVCEGIRMHTEKIIKEAIESESSMILCLNKIDRFILELKIGPQDAFNRLRMLIDEANTLIAKFSQKVYLKPKNEDFQNPYEHLLFNPSLGNVIFSSSEYQFCFSLKQMANIYCERLNLKMNVNKFSKFLWGDFYYNNAEGKFQTSPISMSQQRTFVEFILEPLYKIFSTLVSSDPTDNQIINLTKSLKIPLYRSDTRLPLRKFMATICSRFFVKFSYGFIDAISVHVPDPKSNGICKLSHTFSAEPNSELFNSVAQCKSGEENNEAPLLVHITKLFASTDATTLSAFGRVFSGVLKAGQKITVLGPSYTAEDPEDSFEMTCGNLYISMTQYNIEVSRVTAGNFVLIDGFESPIFKNATIIDVIQLSPSEYEPRIFKPIIYFGLKSVLKISIEPKNPSELPKMLEGLRKILQTYPSIQIKVEESGEHVILGSGELQLDCVMHDLRKFFAECDLRVSDPSVAFCETAVETSALKCFAVTPNGLNKFTMIAEPLEKGLAEKIEDGDIPIDKWTVSQQSEYLCKNFNWDSLSARKVWAFGSDSKKGPCVLVDDTIPIEVNQDLLSETKNAIISGFQWACREGPLCDDPMRSIKFRILDVQLASQPQQRSAGQIIPTVRRVAYSAFLMATPRMMEPYYLVESISPADCVSGVYTVLGKRRGHIIYDNAIAGSPLYCVRAYVPAIDSFGLETDLRIHTQGQAFCMSTFDHWQIVPGDPLDKSIVLEILKPQQTIHLAREFMLKSRRRKGLNEDVSVNKFFDDPMLLELAKQDMIFTGA